MVSDEKPGTHECSTCGAELCNKCGCPTSGGPGLECCVDFSVPDWAKRDRRDCWWVMGGCLVVIVFIIVLVCLT